MNFKSTNNGSNTNWIEASKLRNISRSKAIFIVFILEVETLRRREMAKSTWYLIGNKTLLRTLNCSIFLSRILSNVIFNSFLGFAFSDIVSCYSKSHDWNRNHQQTILVLMKRIDSRLTSEIRLFSYLVLSNNFSRHRALACSTGELFQASGSARWSQGYTSVLAAVYGPCLTSNPDANEAGILDIAFNANRIDIGLI